MPEQRRIAVIGAGLAGSSVAVRLASAGWTVDLYDQNALPMSGASLNGEGKLHLGYVYSADPTGTSWRVMTGAALNFADTVCTTFRLPPGSLTMSAPFLYAIPATTALDPDAIERHFRAVDTHIAQLGAQLPPARRLGNAELREHFDPASIIAAYTTAELAIDPLQLAHAVRNRLAGDHRIRLFSQHRVLRATPKVSGGFALDIDGPEGEIHRTYDYVVNASWQDRLRLDKSAGISPARQAISRYKASIIFADLPKTLLARIPNATFALGAFGDILKRNRDELYLSWYPACKLGETTELDTRAMISRAKSTRPDRWLIDETIKGLSGFAPAVAELAQFADRARVGGGAIVAWGRTDITDPGSGLHARGGIGVTRTGGWISINTGKLTTAPLFARQAAAMILEPLSA